MAALLEALFLGASHLTTHDVKTYDSRATILKRFQSLSYKTQLKEGEVGLDK